MCQVLSCEYNVNLNVFLYYRLCVTERGYVRRDMRTREYSLTRTLRVFQKTDFFLFVFGLHHILQTDKFPRGNLDF